tara:strand:- start:79 stop:375 length:297 start_codon:yes stop_codon:yes gene_type:complete
MPAKKGNKPRAKQPDAYYDDFEFMRMLKRSTSYEHLCELLYGEGWNTDDRKLGKQTFYLRRRKLKEEYNISTEMLPNWGKGASGYKKSTKEKMRSLFD